MSQLQNDEGDKVTQVLRETEGGFEPCNESPRRGSWGRTGRLVKPKWKETNVLRCFSPGRKSLVMEPPRPPQNTHTHTCAWTSAVGTASCSARQMHQGRIALESQAGAGAQPGRGPRWKGDEQEEEEMEGDQSGPPSAPPRFAVRVPSPGRAGVSKTETWGGGLTHFLLDARVLLNRNSAPQ